MQENELNDPIEAEDLSVDDVNNNESAQGGENEHENQVDDNAEQKENNIIFCKLFVNNFICKNKIVPQT